MSTVEAPRRRRRRWPIVLVALVVLLALLAVAGEFGARQYADGYVRDRIAEPLGARPADVDVDLGDGSLLLQAVTNHLTVVTASTDDAKIAGLDARTRLTARNVTLTDRQAGAVRVEIAVPNQRALTALVDRSVDVDAVAFRDGRLVVTKKVSVLGRSLDLVETLSVGANGGRVVFTPQRLTVAGAEVDLDGVRRGPLASILSGLTKPQSTCVNESLPAGVSLLSAKVDGSTLRLVAGGIQVNLSGSGKGSCS